MAELVTLEQAKTHLNVVSNHQDADIRLKLRAAEEIAIDFLDRAVFASVQEMSAAVEAGTAGPDPIVVNARMQLGILMILGDLFENREDVVLGTIATQLPTGSMRCLRPMRRQGV